ncbi:hypothetical protein [uncultured Microbulbifer sp.]|uniref:hypothetical protein n=1 Tax=uncultured Microbulbifer sp. TaxID=348147 RepID=UPI002633587F|nr:hypothetical protein [uncultured Microbulbifer sp.]
MNRTLTFIVVMISLTVSADEPEVPETIWIQSDKVVSCHPSEFKPSDTLQVKLGKWHGKELAVYRHDENLWLFMVVSSPPLGMISLMTPKEFESAKSFEITPSTRGYRRDNEEVFSKSGNYTLYVSQNLESEDGGYKCELIVKNH